MDALKDSDLLHWKHSLSKLIDISIAQKTAIWRLYGRRCVFKPAIRAARTQVLLQMSGSQQTSALRAKWMEVVCAGG